MTLRLSIAPLNKKKASKGSGLRSCARTDTNMAADDPSETANEIRKLWRTPTFSGSFAGLATFQLALATEKNIQISRSELLKIMQKEENFLIESQKIKKKFPRRQMNIHGFCSTWQADLAIMFPFNGYIGFLLCIDVFSRNIFCARVKSKSAENIRNAFQYIFKTCGDTPDKLETDRGTEFIGNRDFFKKKKIFLKFKTGPNKASFAEHGIMLVKRRLFRLLRALLTKNWPKYLYTVARALNNTPNSAIGGLKPSIIKSRLDTPIVDRHIGFHPDVSFEKQVEHQEKYVLNPKKLQSGAYVYVHFPPAPLGKSFDSRNYQLFQIERVDAGKNPPLYQIKDLLGEIQPGFFYREQLLLGEKPASGDFFRIEKILGQRQRNGKTEYLLKYLHYPNKFNQWVPESNFKK